MEESQHRLGGMTGFLIFWSGQLISILASSMTGFGMTIWMYQQTKSATAMGLMQVFFITPFLIMSPIAGVMVDRYNRKLMMMISDLAAGVSTLGILILYATGHLEFWHLYVAAILNGIGNTFQWPAYSAAISTMVPKEQYGRVNGMMTLMEAGPAVFAPLFAGALIPLIGLPGIMLIDVVTFVFAIGTLAIIYVPQPAKTVEGQQESGSFWREAIYGFTYIFARPSLLGLQLVFLAGNLFTGIGQTLSSPMVLARTDSNTVVFGAVQTAGAVGGIVGGIIISFWGGFHRRVHGVVGGWMVSGLALAWYGFGNSMYTWFGAVILMGLISPLINSSNQSIWMAKVAPDVQGRVFSARRLIAWSTMPISPIIAGLMADLWLEPLMKNSASAPPLLSKIVGTGPGAGMAAVMLFCGLGILFVGIAGYLTPAVYNAESLLPDHDQLEKAAT